MHGESDAIVIESVAPIIRKKKVTILWPNSHQDLCYRMKLVSVHMILLITLL